MRNVPRLSSKKYITALKQILINNNKFLIKRKIMEVKMKVTYELRQFVSKKLFKDSKLGFKTIKVFDTEQDAWTYKTKLEEENPDTIYSITRVILLNSIEEEKENLKEFADDKTTKD